MQLDQTRIAIRERSLLDILDMSLRVTVVFARPLLKCFGTVIFPLMLLNGWLTHWMVNTGDEEFGYVRYTTAMVCLVTIQAPLLSIAVTPFLGSTMFMQSTSPNRILKTVARSWFPLFLSHLIYRGVAIAIGLVVMIPHNDEFSGWEVWLILLTIATTFPRATRPYINEIILLERNPIRAHDPNVITIGRRNAALHGPNAGDLFARWLGSALIAIVLVLSIFGSIWFLAGMLLFNWEWGPWMIYIWFPLTLWVVAAYFSVVRFLCYMDLRIRREGWEVELIIRAAAAQLIGALP